MSIEQLIKGEPDWHEKYNRGVQETNVLLAKHDNYEQERLALEAATGGKNTIILDDVGKPSIMVRIPKFKWSDIVTGGEDKTCSAFIVNGVEVEEIFISKYQNVVIDGRAYSLGGKDPRAYVDFDQAKQYCEAKGEGWHLMTNAEWSAIAHYCKKNGYMPSGNNNYGKDIANPLERGVVSYKYDSSGVLTNGRTLTGSGPTTWNHDNSTTGICDMNGNVWEWVGGLRLNEGEIQIIPDNDAAKHVDQSYASPLWKAILQNGSLVAPGTANTLKYDATNAAGNGASKINTTITNKGTESVYMYNVFQTTAAVSGVTVPIILKELGLFPVDDSHGNDGLWARNNGERLPFRGGSFGDGAGSGVFAIYMNLARAFSFHYVGFRSAFVKL